MLSELRPIHFSTDLIFPPLNLSTAEAVAHHRARIKTVYDQLRSEKRIDFNKMDVDTPAGPHLWSRRPSGAETRYSFLNDRIRAQDEWTERTLEQFADEVKQVVDICFRVFNLPVIIIQGCVVRATAKPHPFEDSREFLLGKGLGLSRGKMAAFGRPAHVAGISIVFPPMKDMLDEQRVLIESYARDPSQLLLEVRSTFRAPLIPSTSQDMLRTNLEKCYTFLDDQVCSFVNGLLESRGEDN